MVLVRFEPLHPLTPDPDFGNLFLCFLASYWGIPIFSIRDSGKLLGEFERTRSFLPTSYWGYPI